MKKRSLKSLALNKKPIANLETSRGGAQPSIMCPSEVWCASHEKNCNSEGPACDCGTTGNCLAQPLDVRH
ncbi:MAG: hypothetical protein AAF617_17395 [Bacteroidota bacterium]